MTSPLRVVIADDERPARSYLTALLRAIGDVAIVGEAQDGSEAVAVIERERPDVAILDLQMPEVDGLGVVRLLGRKSLPLVIFATAYDEFAVKAFEVNAVDYVTKPVTELRLRQALTRVRDRLEREDLRASAQAGLEEALDAYEETAPARRLERIPVRQRGEILLLPVSHVASVVADGELLQLSTFKQDTYTIAYRLKDLEARLDPDRFIRLGRGTLANVDAIAKAVPLPGGTYRVKLSNGQELDVSRIQSRVLKTRLLQL